jgi:hypothetical protein
MMIVALFLIFALLFGFGFAANWLWFLAVFYLVFWVIGVAMGRGESAGRYRFYRW